MKTALALTLALAALPLAAETLVIDGQVQIRPAGVQLPARGLSMAAVEQRFGAPKARHAAVGRPPITRWDYPGFSVYFEYEHVVRGWELHTLDLTEMFASDLSAEQLVDFCLRSLRRPDAFEWLADASE